MQDKLERVRDWFLKQSNPVKAILAVGAIILIILIIYLGLVFSSDSPLTGDALTNYKASCTVINFNELNSNVNKYMGQHITFMGQIVQINQNNGQTQMVLAVTQVNGGWSTSNLIYVTYRAQTNFKRGDVVTVYGDVTGTYNYISDSFEKLILVKITGRDVELTPITSQTIVPVPYTSSVANASNTTNSSGNSSNSAPPASPTNPTPITTNPSPSNIPT